MTVSGSPDSYRVRLLLPSGKMPSIITVDNTPVEIQSEKIESSVYVIVDDIPLGEHVIIAKYK